MAAVSQRTLSWLWDVLQREYRDPQRAYADLAQTLALHPTFAPRTDVYTYENGASLLLVNLKGTIPVNFRGNQYRFPIAIWLPHAYPTEPPMFYVTPTDDMVVRPGQHVSPSDGRIYHPYLARWREAWERSTVADFLKLLVDVFTREPPVMVRSQMPPAQFQPRAPPRPPPPNEQRAPPARPPSIGTASTPQPPLPPPKPSDQISMRGTPNPFPNQQPPSRYDAPPPLPSPGPRPPSISSSPMQSYPPQQRPYPQQQMNLRQSYAAQQGPPTPVPPPFANQGLRHSIASPQVPVSTPQIPPHNVQVSRQQQQQQSPLPMAYPVQQPLPYQQQHPQQQYGHVPQSTPAPAKPQQPNIMDDSPFEVKLGAGSANLPTPAIPPNPEKQHILQSLQSTLLVSLQTQITQSSSALAPLQSQHAALQIAQQSLQQELSQLQLLQSQLQQNVESLTSTIAAADRTINSARNESSPSKIPNVDDLVIPPTVVARQLYDSVAEQRGYEAAIFALTEGFVRGRIGGEMWARKTRECAREEFRRKWLVKRVGRGMGLDMSQVEGSSS